MNIFSNLLYGIIGVAFTGVIVAACIWLIRELGEK